jgi:hypothetical protein
MVSVPAGSGPPVLTRNIDPSGTSSVGECIFQVNTSYTPGGSEAVGLESQAKNSEPGWHGHLTSECITINVCRLRRRHVLWCVYVLGEYVSREGWGDLYSALAYMMRFSSGDHEPAAREALKVGFRTR